MRRNKWLWWGLALVAAGVLVVAVADPGGAAWGWGPGATGGPGMMGRGFGYGDGTGFGPGMMGGTFGPGMMGGGMMGGWRGQAPAPGQKPISLEDARTAVERYLVSVGDKRFATAELWSFADGPYYAAIEEREGGRGAFELLVDRYTGAVYPEPGPNMMWNLKYGMMGGGMMGGRAWVGAPKTGEVPRIAREAAEEKAQAYLDRVSQGAKVRAGGHEFYGYWTLHFDQDGKLAGMLSVNAATGDVWLHTWHAAPTEVVGEKHD